MPEQAYRIRDLARPHGPIAKSTLFRHAAKGLLRTRKVGGATVVLADDWRAYLAGETAAYSTPRSNAA